MGILERIAANRRPQPGADVSRYAIDQWITQSLIPSYFQYGGVGYQYGLRTTMDGQKVQQVSNTLPSYAHALRSCPPAFAAQMVRALVLGQMRFTWRNLPSHPTTPRRTFGSSALSILERPWPGATTQDLVSTMEWHAGLAGTAFVVREAARNGEPERLRVLRPDWCGLIYGSELEPDNESMAATAPDGKLLGLVYQNGGLWGGHGEMVGYLPGEFAMWSPIPDPERPGLGQSWVTAALTDIQGDQAATQHKLNFFVNGATPNMVVSGIPATTEAQFKEIVELLEARHTGLANAYKTLYLTAGADAKVVGADMRQLDFKVTQGGGETRIAMLGRVPAPLLGISEGLAGSSLNAGNFGMARRIFADSWIYPTMQDIAASLETIVSPPANRRGVRDAELWFDTKDMPILREDAKDLAEIRQMNASALRQLTDSGWEPDAAIDYMSSDDVTIMRGRHTGVFSVQLQPPLDSADANATKAKPPATEGKA